MVFLHKRKASLRCLLTGISPPLESADEILQGINLSSRPGRVCRLSWGAAGVPARPAGRHPHRCSSGAEPLGGRSCLLSRGRRGRSPYMSCSCRGPPTLGPWEAQRWNGGPLCAMPARSETPAGKKKGGLLRWDRLTLQSQPPTQRDPGLSTELLGAVDPQDGAPGATCTGPSCLGDGNSLSHCPRSPPALPGVGGGGGHTPPSSRGPGDQGRMGSAEAAGPRPRSRENSIAGMPSSITRRSCMF